MIKLDVTHLVPGFSDYEFTQIKSAKHYHPDWYKSVPHKMTGLKDIAGYEPKKINLMKSMKSCPSFSEIWTEAYVLPAPCDLWLYSDELGARGEVANPEHWGLSVHPRSQYVDFLPKESGIKDLFNFRTHWCIYTPKGYSVRLVPLLYNFDNEWEVPYGVIQTDRVHDLNIQFHYKSKEKEILIQQGEPLCYIIPFKREDSMLNISEHTKKFDKKLNIGRFKVRNKFRQGYLRNK